MTVALVVAVALSVAVVVYVALPFLREPEPESDALVELDESERQRLELLEARDRSLAALKEIEFDHRTGTLTDEDYRALVGPLRQEAARTLKELDRLESETVDRTEEEGRPPRGRTST
ncbi:MAG: hypothetical protein R6W48_04645 [Gaiellaceae bacterium]